MSDWIKTKIGMQAMENIVRYLPRITVALEEIAKSSKLKWSEQEILRLAEEEQSNFEGKSTKNS